uniref:Uncharacterized protein n=1 Tax=Anguilla anguilla TaxID=7936 RepID=A0A0E9SSA1_ANGAN
METEEVSGCQHDQHQAKGCLKLVRNNSTQKRSRWHLYISNDTTLQEICTAESSDMRHW